jgi:phosphosulfolactate synthase
MLSLLPEREQSPRKTGVTMVMDKGLGVRQAQDLAETTGHLIDFLKLGFGTSVACRKVDEKVKIYRDHGIKVYVGGTLFEAFYVRDQLEAYVKFIDNLGCDAVEISDGSIMMHEDEKCSIIEKLSKKYTVVSEVGAKDSEVLLESGTWATSMHNELAAGSSFVIGEARESGTVGIYEKSGKADTGLIFDILKKVPGEKIIWEAPLKSQQVWFIKQLGSNVNLGNIAPAEVAALETLRLGLRGDTFFDFLPEGFNNYKLTK